MIRELAPVAISYSGGASSEWLVEATWRGVIPAPARYAVFFADTGEEHAWTYAAVAEVEARCRARGITFIACRRPGDSLGDHVINAARERRTRMDHPPFYVDGASGAGRIEQRCTREWKARTLRRAKAQWLTSIGIRKRKRLTSWIGFSADEQHRATSAVAARAEVKWESIDFPAIRLGVTREQQRAQLIEWTGRAPMFSMCTFCPFKTPQRWRETPPPELERAREVDAAIRDLSFMGITRGEVYVSNRLVAIGEGHDVGGDAEDAACTSGYCFT